MILNIYKTIFMYKIKTHIDSQFLQRFQNMPDYITMYNLGGRVRRLSGSDWS